MNLNPHQPDETIDDALLNEALAEPTPQELEAKILALTDPSMMSLLDEALAPEPASEALTQRILAATQPVHQPATAPSPTVLARIGPITLRYAAAAAIALAFGVGVYVLNQGQTDTGSTARLPDTPGTPSDPDTVASADDPDWLTQVQLVSSENYFGSTTEQIEDTLNSVADSLDNAVITRDTLWAELDAYEQFLDDFES